jgi:His/Glu/Gln/Arg/opine family amino acid ABC transporter permease subunit
MTILLTYLPAFLNGLSITLVLTLTSVFIGFGLAILLTIGSLSDFWSVRKIVDGLVFFIRGTPLLVQIFLIYYGSGQFAWLRESFLWPIFSGPMYCAIMAFSLNSACYTTVLLQGAIKSVPKNEIAACEAFGMGKWLAFRRIIFPRALRIALPAYSNEVIMVLKGTSLASTITLLDLMGVTQQLIAQTYQTVPLYLMVGAIYLLLNAIVMGCFKLYRDTYKV